MQRGQVFAVDFQHLCQRPRAHFLRAFLGQQARQLQAGIVLGHLQPAAAVFAGLVHGGDAMTGLRAEGIYQCGV